MFSIRFCDNPTAEARAKGYSDLGAPLIQGLAFDHVPELLWRDAQLVNRFLELIKFLIDNVHDVLLTLCCVRQVLIMPVLT